MPSLLFFDLTATRGTCRAAVFAKGPDAEDLDDICDVAVSTEPSLATTGRNGLCPALEELFRLTVVVENALAVQVVGVDITVFDKPLWERDGHRCGVRRDDELVDEGAAGMRVTGVDLMALDRDAEGDDGQRPAGFMACRIVRNQLHGVGSWCGGSSRQVAFTFCRGRHDYQNSADERRG